MLWVTDHFSCIYFCQNWPAQNCWLRASMWTPALTSRRLGVAAAGRMGNALFVLSGKISFVKMWVTFHTVLPRKRPSVFPM
uniref:Uncharacterized protein n=1 Tax=Spermophilus dauricus TaxID=99837 RepID=A0A8C9QAU2_SPEDA